MAVDFIGVGAQKTGTSWLYACLYEHPEICAPIKELHFFSRDRYHKGIKWYEQHFSRCKQNSKTGEFSTSYLYSEDAALRIAKAYPAVKLIAILREPRARAYSQYRNAIKAGEIDESISFESYVDSVPSAIEQGLYFSQLSRFWNVFAESQILVLLHEDIESDPQSAIKKVYQHIEVDSDFAPPSLNSRINVARTPKRVGPEKLMHYVAEKLRKTGLDRVVYYVRQSGLPDWVRSKNTKKEIGNLSKESFVIDSEYFKADAEKLGVVIGRDLVTEWKL